MEMETIPTAKHALDQGVELFCNTLRNKVLGQK